MLDKQPNRLDSPDLRGAEKAMARVSDIVKAREQAADIMSTVGVRNDSRQLVAAASEEQLSLPDEDK